MEKKEFADVLDWVKATDLVEVSFKDKGKGFSFSKHSRPVSAVCGFPGRNLAAVSSPGVGLFRWNEAGRPRTALEGKAVSAGDLLGLVEGAGAPLKVEAPCAGVLANVCVDEGKTVQYGQPLFFIDKKN